MFDNSDNPTIVASHPEPFCPRQITFELKGSPGVLITATETGTGAIDFVVDVEDTPLTTADLRALFFHFNEAKLGGLQISGGDGLLTERRIGLNNVLDLGDGATLAGAVKTGFDIGLEWGTPGGKKDDIDFPVHFTLSRAANDLTLDDFATLQFGAKLDSVGGPGGPRGGATKILGVAPYAPDAKDDALSIFEDGAAGLTSPSKTPTAVTLNVLGNDIDGDGDLLTITSFHDGPSHGSVAISADGKSVLYTPDLDYAGTDSFEYCVSDGRGGQDSAVCTVTIVAVADKPTVTYSVTAGADATHFLLTLTGDQTDFDSSEFLDKIAAGGAPLGVTVSPGESNPATEPDQLIQAFNISVAPNQSYSFNLTFTATAQETSNGDTETGAAIVPIVIEYKENSAAPDFQATDQSIWGPGDAFIVEDNRFIGVNPPGLDEEGGSIIGYVATATLKAGFQSTLHFNGGEIDAQLNYDLSVDTTFNKTTDTLQIRTSASPTGGSFATTGPSGDYNLDFIFDFRFHVAITYDVGVDSGDLYGFDIGDSYSQNIFHFSSETLSLSTGFPAPFSGVTATVQWPNITTSGGASPPPAGEVSGSGASNNFLQLDADIDQILSDVFLGGFNPFDIPFDVGLAEGNFELIDLDIAGGLNLLQSFALQPTSMTGTIHFEDGSNQAIVFGTDIVIQNASQIDVNGNNNGHVDYFLTLDPVVTLRNQTDVGLNVSYSFDLVKITGSYDIGVDSGSIDIGPLFHADGSLPVGDLNVYDKTFEINFASQNFSFFA